jgi:hypothetical protein
MPKVRLRDHPMGGLAAELGRKQKFKLRHYRALPKSVLGVKVRRINYRRMVLQYFEAE